MLMLMDGVSGWRPGGGVRRIHTSRKASLAGQRAGRLESKLRAKKRFRLCIRRSSSARPDRWPVSRVLPAEPLPPAGAAASEGASRSRPARAQRAAPPAAAAAARPGRPRAASHLPHPCTRVRGGERLPPLPRLARLRLPLIALPLPHPARPPVRRDTEQAHTVRLGGWALGSNVPVVLPGTCP